MKTRWMSESPKIWKPTWQLLPTAMLLAALLPANTVRAAEVDGKTNDVPEINVTKDAPPADTNTEEAITSVRPIQPRPLPLGAPLPEPREVAWLGVATQEAPEVLASQMNLDPGVGLVITFVAENSPAARAGLERNDLLVALNDQSLVLPAQLRKLVQSRAEGDSVRLTYYRNGRKQKAEVELGKTTLGPWGDAEGWREQLRRLQKQLGDVNLGEALRDSLGQMRESLGDLKINQREIQEQVRAAVEQARHAANNPEVREQIKRAMEEARHAMEEARGAMSGITVPRPPNAPDPFRAHPPKVTVRSSGDSAQSVVRADDTGTYVLVRNPRLRLTAHDHNGKLLFDGEIETEKQRASVPPELWEKVKPLVDKLSAGERDRKPRPTPGPPPQPEREIHHGPGTI